MSTIPQLSAAELRRAAEVQTRIEALQAELAAVLGGTPTPVAASAAPAKAGRPKGRLSSAGRAKIIAASKAYWAERKAGAEPVAAKSPAKKKRVMSAAGRARLAKIAKARWAKVKASGKSKL